ncbi:MAG TPA: hypothetical protein VNT42_05660, partial [Sphingomonas sp.]|nr:hypothetical protein [Sphingomonas sp.]
ALAFGAQSASGQEVVRGDAAAGLVSHRGKGEVHLVVDPELRDRRMVLKIVILNLSGAPQTFGPDAVTAAAGDANIALITREALLAEQSGAGISSDETATSHSAATLPVTGTGQTDVTSFTGGMGGGIAGVPTSSIDRSQRRSRSADTASLDAVLLKPMTIAPNRADGGQVVTEKLKRTKAQELTVAVTFAGEIHRFAVKAPR